MLFRLQCSADRQGQIFNVHSALIVHDNMDAPTSGVVSDLAISGMRTLSQRIFELFRQEFIAKGRNFFVEVDNTPDHAFLGEAAELLGGVDAQLSDRAMQLADQVLAARSLTKTFVVFQLTNKQPPSGSGVGCGFYDLSGSSDQSEIHYLMSSYLFDTCFNPQIREENIQVFADYCLRSLTSSFWAGGEADEDYVATKQGLTGALDDGMLRDYWRRFGPRIKEKNLPMLDRRVVTMNYTANYKDDLAKVFSVLDAMQEPSSAGSQ